MTVHEIEMLAEVKATPMPTPSFFEPDFVTYPVDPEARLYPVNATIVVPNGPTEVWSYRVAALNPDEARVIVERIFGGSAFEVTRVLVLPAISGAYEFVGAQVRQ